MAKRGEIFKGVRILLGKTREDVAAAVDGASVSTVLRLEHETGDVNPETVAQVAGFLGLKYDWKTGGIEPPKGHSLDAIVTVANEPRTVRRAKGVKPRPITLPPDLSDKARRYAAAEKQDVMEWLEAAIDDAAPKPINPKPGLRSGSNRRRAAGERNQTNAVAKGR